MKFRYSLLIFLSFFLFISFLVIKPTVSSAFADTVTLSGSVKDSSGNAIGNATVTVNDPNNDSTTTDPTTGQYSFSIPSGTYNIQVTPPSGSGFTSVIALSQNISSNTVLNFVLTPTGSATLSGHVYDAVGVPLSGQRVMLQTSSGAQYLTSTDSSGAYSLQAPTGTYAFLFVMNVNANNFTTSAPERYQAIVQNYNLSQSTIVDFTIPAKKVIIHVQDGSNTSVSNVALSTSNSGSNGLQLGGGITANIVSKYGEGGDPTLTTDSQGNATLWLIPSQNYTITATPANGSSYVATSLSNVSITSDTTLTMTLPQTFTLSGHVYDATGAPLASQRVMLQTSNGTQYVTLTDNSGAYSLQAPANTYAFLFVMSVNPNSFSVNAPERYEAIAQNYTLSQNTNADFTVPAKKVILHVQDALNNPISNASIQTSNSGSNGLTISPSITANVTSSYGNSGDPSPTTDAQGNITLWLVPSQNYTITAIPPNNSGYTTNSLSNQSITADTSLTITLSKSVTLSGHVYGPLGDPLSGQRVMLQTSSGTQYVTATDGNGAYSLQAPLGNYAFLFVMNVNANSFSVNAPERYEAIAQNYTLSQNTTADFTIPAKKVIVHVQDAANNPVKNVSIQTSNSGSNGLVISPGISANSTSVYGTGGDPIPATDNQGNVTLWLIPSQNYTFTAMPPTGSIYNTFTLTNVSITSDQTEIVSLQYNHATPTTTASLSTPFSDGTYSDPTNVTLSASAAAGYTVANTYYKIDGGAQQTYSTPFTVTGAGSHTITYWSVDNTGVTEAANTKTFTITEAYNLTGTVYNDANQNGFQDTGESGVAGATVSLNTGQTTTTDSNGTYTFSTLESGTYTEILTVPTGYTPTTTNPVSVPLAANTTENFGIAQQQATPVVAINAGGDTQGDYAADTDYSGGTTYSSSDAVDTSAVTNPAPQAVYQTVRYGNTFSYTIPNLSANGTYTVRLHFNELYWNAAGQRVFNVALNGSQVLSNFDIYQTAGGKNKAITEQFPATADSNGNITINFSTVTDNAMVNGIEVYSGTLPSPTPTPTPTPVSSYAISAGGPGAGSYVADTDFTGGTTYNTSASIDTSNVTNPAPQSVYQNVRYGNFSYTIPTYSPNTNYSVRLDFAEPYWNAAGQREFNVTINGTQVLNNFDVYQEAGGQNKAVAETFTTTSDSNGLIHIQFTTVTDNAMVSGIQISQQ